jgi:hypothetical protein
MYHLSTSATVYYRLTQILYLLYHNITYQKYHHYDVSAMP